MYFVLQAHDRTQQAGLRGFAQIGDTSQRQRSLDAILRALQLNPVGGYVKGSLARKQLEEAFESVPPTSALEVFNQLGKGEGPLGRLFRYRLHDATQKAMLKILEIKINEQKRQQLEAEQKLKVVMEEQQKFLEKAQKELAKQCARLKDTKKGAEEVCKSQGEDSDLCQQVRFALLELQTAVDDLIRLVGGRCP